MKFLKESGRVGKSYIDTAHKLRQETLSAWEETGFLNGLEGHKKDTVAQLFENQAARMLSESTTSDSSGSFETVAFPIIRRVFSKLLANDIVSVQALNQPIGKIFYMVPKTSEREEVLDGSGNVTGYKHAPTAGFPDCFGESCSLTSFQCKSLYDLYYNDGLFDHSKGEITIEQAAGVPVVLAGCVNGKDQWDALSSGNVEISSVDGNVREVKLEITDVNGNACGYSILSGSNGDYSTAAAGNKVDTESFLASLKVVTNVAINDANGDVMYAAGTEVPFRLVTQKYGKGIFQTDRRICDEQGRLYIGLELLQPNTNAATTQDGYVGISAADAENLDLTVSYATYSSLEAESEMGEVSFDLEETTVAVETRKLRAKWTPELAQDVSAFHNIDAEAELTALLSEQIASEIDREILRDLRKGGAWNARFDYYGWKNGSAASTIYTQKEWNQELITKINQISAQIHKSTLRGGANFIVVSSEVSAMLDNLEYFHVSNAAPEEDKYNMGIEKVGTLSGRYQVYRDPYAKAGSVLVGHKGSSLLDAGYVYAPYIPLQLTPTIVNPFDFTPVKGIMTRYAKKMVNNRFYGNITVDNIPTYDVNELR